MSGFWSALWFWFACILFVRSVAIAQMDDDAGAEGGSGDSAASATIGGQEATALSEDTVAADGSVGASGAAIPSAARAPRVLFLPEVEVPAAALSGPDDLLATVRVEVDGRATLVETSASSVLREKLLAALAGARFVPAEVNGEPRVALVRLVFKAAAESAHGPTPAQGTDRVQAQSMEERSAEFNSSYGARAEVEQSGPHVRELSLAEMREVPGAFGDPFRVLETLPGVAPMLSGVSYVYVRGASPAGTLYAYDGIPVPALFHLALGPAVVHPRMLGDLDFYAAVPPARYGRFSGGVFAAEGLSLDPDAPVTGELELRLVDAQGMISLPIAEGRLAVGGRYGYPGPLLSLFTDVSLSYWDYQVRFDYPLGGRWRSETTLFGSHDALGEGNTELLSLQFHRLETRLIHEAEALSYGVSLLGGYEASALDDQVALKLGRVSPRVFAVLRLPRAAVLRMGAEFMALMGELDLSSMEMDNGDDVQDGLSLEEELTARFIESAPSRQVLGYYAEVEWPLSTALTLVSGLRSDTWITGGQAKVAVDPRLTVSLDLGPELVAHLASGVAHQLAVMPIPLPGLSELALADGLQTAYQSEIGLSWDMAADLQFEVTGYYNYLDNLVLAERSLRRNCDGGADGTCRESGLARGAVHTYGAEFFIRKLPDDFPLAGWLSYTLGWATGVDRTDRAFTPEFDIRHLANLVLQWNVGGGFKIGGRLHYRTGGFAYDIPVFEDGINTGVDNPIDLLRSVGQRLPSFFRADASISYGWTPSWGRMRLSLEWLNVTLSREAKQVGCQGTPEGRINCSPQYLPAILFPNIGLRAEF